MIREDYRRALIMLRSLRRGVSGHVRLERRTLLATLQFAVCGAGETRLQGFLLGRVQRQWRGMTLGSFGAPRYGQAGLTVKFDPRNLQGLTLEQYELIGVAEETPEGYRPVLFGNLNGSVECTFECIQEECARLFARLAPPAAGLPEADSREEAARSLPEDGERETEDETGEDAQSEPDDLDAPAQDSAEGAEAEAQSDSDDLDAPAQDSEDETGGDAQSDSDDLDTPAQDSEDETGGDAQSDSDDLDVPAREPGTRSRSQLSIRDCDWPESLSELRAFFASEPSEEPFALEGYTFVRAGLACVGGAEYCLIGVRAQEGRIDSVCYAVPAQPGETEPPAGLENYRLQDGYWIYCQAVE